MYAQYFINEKSDVVKYQQQYIDKYGNTKTTDSLCGNYTINWSDQDRGDLFTACVKKE